MMWFFLSFGAALLWAAVNHIDKYLIEKYFKGGGIGALMIFSTLFALIVLPVIIFIEPAVLSIGIGNASKLLLLGIITAFTILLYLHALEEEETSAVVPFFQLIPVFGYILGYIFLGEVLSKTQIIGGLIVLVGAAILSLEFDIENNFKLKKKPVLLMLTSTFLIALAEVSFKEIALLETFWISTFWSYIGLSLFGIIIFIFIKSYRREFISTWKINKGSVLSLNIGSEIITILGNLAFSFATLIAPIALVMIVNAYQPVLVFIGGIILTLFFPKIATENLTLRHLSHKLIAIIIILIGSYLIYT